MPFMTTLHARVAWILALAAAGFLAASPLHAGLSPADRALAQRLVRTDPFFALAPGSDLVVVATPIAKRSRWSPDHQRILTDWRLEVGRTLRGPARPFLDLTLEGGEIGDVGLAVSDAPKLALNTRYALLLKRHANAFRVRAGAAGARRLPADTLAADSDVRRLDLVLKSGVMR
jgi:hypothetical protein